MSPLRARLSAIGVAVLAGGAILACSGGPGRAADHATAAPAVAAPAIHDWPTYHYNGIRSGNSPYIGTVHSGLHQVWNRSLDGAVYGSPIVAGGHMIVVTENDTVYEMKQNAVVWKHHLGTPVPRSSLPCGNIDPLGITGTPIYDRTTNTVVVVAELANPIRHTAVGLDPATGRMKWYRKVDVPSNVPGITPAAMQQRAALNIAGRSAYVAYGGLTGDCSSYRGSVVGLNLDRPMSAALTDMTVPTSREAGIWAPPGPSLNTSDNYLLVAVGNGATAETGSYDKSDSVLKISATGILDSFSPSSWRADNRDDLDLGSQGPAIVGNHLFIAGKSGTAYVLDRNHLGGIGGEIHSQSLCRSFGGTALSDSTVFVPCTDGIRAVRIGADGTMSVLWHTQASITGSPVLGGGRLWAIDSSAGRLYSLDPATGAVRASVSIGSVNRFATPMLVQRSVLIGTLSGVVAFNWT
ncbi:MAG: PQQ-binding-like beta-propeller repeat protein [Mycobacteriales bacterium]